MGTINRLGVIDRGESAVRVLNAVVGLNHTDGGAPIATVLFTPDPGAQPWYGREADEVVRLTGFDGRPRPDEVVAALQRAQVDTVWLGDCPTPRTELIEACELGGIGVVGPTADVVRALAERTRLADLAAQCGLALDSGPAPGRRMVEVDVLADHSGAVWALENRDVTVAHDGQVMVAESPSPATDPALAATLADASRRLMTAAGYRGAGVVRFSILGGSVALVGVDTVARPEHATTEERTGTSIIAWRLRIHRGDQLPATEPTGDGVTVEARVVARDPSAGCAPSGGRIALLSFPVGTGVRIDANRRVGDHVESSDLLVAVVTAWGPDPTTARLRLRRALGRTAIVIEGGATNRAFLLDVLDRDELAEGSVDEEWLQRLLDAGDPTEPDPVVLLAGAVEAYEADRALAQQAFYAAAGRGRPEQPEDLGAKIELGYAERAYLLQVDRTGPRDYTVRHGDDVADVTVDPLNDFERRISCGGRRHRVVVTPLESAFRIELDGAAHRVDRQDGLVVRAGWPALIVAALVSPGQHVTAGTPIAVLESMKMETTVTAPFDGEVIAVSITANAQVERGAPLMRIRPRTAAVDDPTHAALSLAGLERRIDFTRKPCDRVYEPLGNYLLGFDLSAPDLRRLLTQQRRLAEIADPADRALLHCEDGLLDIYAQLGSLYRPKTERESDGEDIVAPAENTQEYLVGFLQWLDAARAGLPTAYQARLLAVLERYGVHSLERSADLESALMWLFRSFGRLTELGPIVTAILERRLANRDALAAVTGADDKARLERLAAATQGRQQAIADLARDVAFHYFDEPVMEAAAADLRAEMESHLTTLAGAPNVADREARVERLVWCPLPMRLLLLDAWRQATGPTATALRDTVLEVYVRRFYRIRPIGPISFHGEGDSRWASVGYRHDGNDVHVVTGYVPLAALPQWAATVAPALSGLDPSTWVVADLVTWRAGRTPDIDDLATEVGPLVHAAPFGREIHRVDVSVTSEDGHPDEHMRSQNLTFRPAAGGAGDAGAGGERPMVEDRLYRNLHPMLAKRLEMWRLDNFELDRRPSPEDVYLFHGVARTNPKDRRLFALAEVRDLGSVTDRSTGQTSYPRLERTALLAMAAMRSELSRFAAADRPTINRMVLDITAPWTVPVEDRAALAHKLAPLTARVGLEKVILKVRIPDGDAEGGLRDAVLHFEGVGRTVMVREDVAGSLPISPISPYKQKVLTAARFGSPYPFEITKLMAQINPRRADLPADTFIEMDLDPADLEQLIPVDRAPGNNTVHLVVGLLINHTEVVPEGIRRVAILSDPTQGLGNLAEPECRRINAALAYAAHHHLPVEWFAVSSGALIAMDSGTENMDWIALTLRRLIEFTQGGGEVNIIVTGINVGGQPYWNAEATMLTHTKGILIMTPASAMVLTGKQALDFSGAVSAEDNFGIGGYDRVMGPNGQAQYWAPSFADACRLLLRHYDLTYVVPGERFPRRRPTSDPADRDVRPSPHALLADSPFTTVGDVFSADLNPDRKQPFDMRSVMRAVADADSEPLERWKDLRDGDTSIVWDTTVGGQPVLLLGLESHTVGRKGFVPADGPPSWTSGTPFPHSSRKTARAVNAASGNRPMVVLANLSGFDGSPESMRRRQLEFGAEIGRAVTNFDGPIVFFVVSRYHGGAFVVFSKALNESMEIAAVEGSYASVIGGAPAAATVFAREVKQRTEKDPRVVAARQAAAAAGGAEAAGLRAHLAETMTQVRSEKLGEVADEFDAIHTIERALQVGSVDRIIAAADLRPYVIDALARGMARY